MFAYIIIGYNKASDSNIQNRLSDNVIVLSLLLDE